MSRVLIVDDQPDLLDIFEKALSRKGHKVITMTSALDCIEYLKEPNPIPDLILMDGILPYMDGWEACRTIKAMGSRGQIPIYMLTGQFFDPDENKGGIGSYDGIIYKPISITELAEIVDKVANNVPVSTLELAENCH